MSVPPYSINGDNAATGGVHNQMAAATQLLMKEASVPAAAAEGAPGNNGSASQATNEPHMGSAGRKRGRLVNGTPASSSSATASSNSMERLVQLMESQEKRSQERQEAQEKRAQEHQVESARRHAETLALVGALVNAFKNDK